VYGALFTVITQLKMRVGFYVCLLAFFGLDRLAGERLFGPAQAWVEIVFTLLAGLSAFYWLAKGQAADSKVEKRKRALFALLRRRRHKERL
jgi:hypothetical protein